MIGHTIIKLIRESIREPPNRFQRLAKFVVTSLWGVVLDGIEDFLFCGAGVCKLTALGGVTLTCKVASRAGTAKLALQAGHSMVCPASSSGISKR